MGLEQWIFRSLVVVLLLMHPALTYGQEGVVVADTPKTENYSPRDTVKRLLSAISEQSDDSLKRNFDLRKTRKLRNVNVDEVIQTFPQLLDRYGSLLPTGMLSDKLQGSDEKGLPVQHEAVGAIRVGDTSISIILENVSLPSGEHRWLVSQQTTLALSEISEQVLPSKINKILPEILIEKHWRGASVGHWLSMPVIVIVSVIAGWLLSRLLARTAGRYQSDATSSRRVRVIRALSTPAGMILAVVLFVIIERYLGISIVIRQDFSILTISVLWVALFIFLWSLMDTLSAHGEQLLREKNRVGSLSLVIFFRASAKVVLVVLAVILVLDSNGVDVTTGLAALGIGGIALALGAQKAIENVVGSVIIVVDQPFRVGDFCKVGEMLGTIENIGLRSTRIRTLEDTLVTFPNGVLSSERIENFTMRRKFLFRTVLNLRYETKTKDLENVLSEMRKMLKESQYVVPDPLRVRFIGYGATSLDVEIFAYIYAGDYATFLERRELLLLNMSQIVESNGSGFAFPSQTLYLGRDKLPVSPLSRG